MNKVIKPKERDHEGGCTSDSSILAAILLTTIQDPTTEASGLTVHPTGPMFQSSETS